MKKLHFASIHSYGCLHQVAYLTGSAILVLLTPILSLFACGYLLAGLLDSFVLFIAGALTAALVLAGISNLYPNIRIYEEGLEVQVFLSGWQFVPWKDVLEWRTSILPSLSGKATSIMLVRHLTPAHYLIGWMYAFSTKPGFLISSSISGYRELRQVIREKMREHGKSV